MRWSFVIALAWILGAVQVHGQNPTPTDPNPTAASANLATATCNFDSQDQLAIQYVRLKLAKIPKNYIGHDVPYGAIWEPGGRALTMFTNTAVNLAGHTIPVGGYTVYLIPERKEWTLIVSKNTDVTAPYDKAKDVARAQMQIGMLPTPEPQLSVYFGHTGPKECTVRFEVADTGVWTAFEQQ